MTTLPFHRECNLRHLLSLQSSFNMFMSFPITKCDPGTKLESSLLNISRRGDSAMQCIGNVTQQTDPAICYSGFKRAGNQAFEGVSQIHRNIKRFTFFHPQLPFFQCGYADRLALAIWLFIDVACYRRLLKQTWPG